MEERERGFGSTQDGGSKRNGCLIAAVLIIAVIYFPLKVALTPAGPGTGDGAFFESVAAFQEKFAPIMAFPTYYPEGFDWRGNEEEWFEYKNERGRVYFDWYTYNLKSDRTRMYANATYNQHGVDYQTRKDLDIYASAMIGVSLAYPADRVPNAWLFYVGMKIPINPRLSNPTAPEVEDTREVLQYQNKEIRFSNGWRDNEGFGRESFTTMSYAALFKGREYRFIFGVWINPELSQEKQDELLAEMKQHCLEEAVKMYDSLEYLEKAKKP